MDHYDDLAKLFESADGDLFRPKAKKHIQSADERLMESFNQITNFVRQAGHLPSRNADDIKEAALGARLDNIRSDKTKLNSLTEYDELGLLALEKAPGSLDELFKSDNGLFSSDLFDIKRLPEKRIVANSFEAAKRTASKNFEQQYKQLFITQQSLLASGVRKLTPFAEIRQLQPKHFYVYDGMMCYVVEFGQKEHKAGGYSQQRILVIFENGTESKMYRRSLAQRLYEGGSVVIDATSNNQKDDGESVGYIYILKSLSTDPKIATIKNLYKIGVTRGTVENRIKDAANDPTYLMAPVKIVDTYKLTGDYQPVKVETMIHRVFADAKVDMEIIDSSNTSYVPDEWYSVPLWVIDEAVDRIVDKSIVDFHYDPKSQILEGR